MPFSHCSAFLSIMLALITYDFFLNIVHIFIVAFLGVLHLLLWPQTSFPFVLCSLMKPIYELVQITSSLVLISMKSSNVRCFPGLLNTCFNVCVFTVLVIVDLTNITYKATKLALPHRYSKYLVGKTEPLIEYCTSCLLWFFVISCLASLYPCMM